MHTPLPAEVEALYRAAVPTPGRRLLVGASDRAAFATAEAAMKNAVPGDRILLEPGDHGYLNVYGLEGEPEAWISIEASDWSDPPIIDVGSTSSDGVDVQRSTYVGLAALAVRGDIDSKNADASGICVFRGSTFVSIWACSIQDFPGGGINCFWTPTTIWDDEPLPSGGWDCVEACFNVITGCCRRSPSNTSGISFFGAEDQRESALPGGFGYRAIGNTITCCRCEVPYRLGGVDFVTDGNGISVDSLAVRNALTPGLPGYLKPGLVAHNTLQDNGGRAVHVYNTSRVHVLQNLAVENLRTESPAFEDAFEIEGTTSPGDENLLSTVVLRDNTARPLPGRGDFRGGRLIGNRSPGTEVGLGPEASSHADRASVRLRSSALALLRQLAREDGA